MSFFNDPRPQKKPPFFATLCLLLLLPKRILDNIIGDLEEEFYELAEQDIKVANKWYWQQSLTTCWVYFHKKLRSIEVVARVNFYLPVTFFIITLGLLSLLSSMTDPNLISPSFWHELMQGKLHTALYTEHFWYSLGALLGSAEWGMLFHGPAFLIAAVSFCFLLYLNGQQSISALRLACYGYSLATVPYVLSILHLSNHALEATQVGPIIATGALSFLYLLPVVSFLVHQKLTQQQASLFQFDQSQE